jgi:hypothetical protein
MNIDRRTAIRHLALFSASAVLLPACMQDHSKSAILLRNFKIDSDQEKLLEELTATLIPTTDTPGAREVSAHLFVLKMLDDCSSPGDRKRFLKGMQLFDNAARSAGGRSFADADAPARQTLLASIDSNKNADPDVRFFYSTTKKLTILAYSSSSWFLTKVQVYELVPGRWHGCMPVQSRARLVSGS